MAGVTPVSFQSSTDDPLERRVSTVGRVQPHLEVKIVDTHGRVVPPGTPGELLTRGYSVMLGYWGDEERTREAIDAARWMHTGDLATIEHVQPQSLTRTLIRLESDALLGRTPDPADGRRSLLAMKA